MNNSPSWSTALDTFARRYKLADVSGLETPLDELDKMALLYVRDHPTCGPTDVARYLGVANTTLSSATDRLAKRGLLERHRPDVDRRAVELRLSEKGVLRAEAYAKAHHELAEQMLLRRNTATTALAEVLSRFSLVAAAAVALVVSSGVANTAFRIADVFGALWSSSYGVVLLVKVSLVGLLLAFAAYNRFVLMPQLSASMDEKNAVRRVVKSVYAEIVLSGLVLAVASILGITPPH